MNKEKETHIIKFRSYEEVELKVEIELPYFFCYWPKTDSQYQTGEYGVIISKYKNILFSVDVNSPHGDSLTIRIGGEIKRRYLDKQNKITRNHFVQAFNESVDEKCKCLIDILEGEV